MSGWQGMAKVEIPYVNEYRSGAKLFRYYRRHGYRVRLRAEPGTAEFAEEYKAAERLAFGLAPAKVEGEKIAQGSLRALFIAYASSPQFKARAPATRQEYRRTIEALYPKYGNFRVATMPSAWVQKLQDELADTPRKANRLVAVLRLLLNWGIKRGWRPDMVNPTAAVDFLPTGDGHRRWKEEEFATMTGEGAPEVAMAITISYYTAQRLGDVLAMRWSDYDGRTISLKQEKTGTPLVIAVHPQLKKILDAKKRELRKAGRIEGALAPRPDGKPWSKDHFKHRFAAVRAALGMPDDLHFHGLRHTALSMLAEAGATDAEMQAIGGHKERGSLTRYTKQASQAKLAASGIAKMKTAKPGTKVTRRRIESD